MSPKVFLTGVTGYIGGTAFVHLYNAHPDWEYNLLVRNEDRAKPVKEKYKDVKFVYGDLDASDVIEKAAAEADIVVHTADSSDHMASAKAISKGLEAGHSAERPGYWIQTSGTSILTWYDVANKRWGEEPLAEQKYHDIDGIESLVSLPDDAPHRDVDKVVLASNSDKVKTVILCPPTIYGNGAGPVNTRSMQIPSMVKATLEKGFAPIAGVGGTEWDHVHINDLGDLFLKVADATQDASKNTDTEIFGLKGYMFAENGSHRWADVAQWIAEEAARQGYLPEALTKITSKKEVEFMDGATTPTYGLNSKGVGERAKKHLGWQPKGPSIKEEIPELLKQEAKAMDMTPKEK